MGSWQKERGERVHYRHLFAFGTTKLIDPDLRIFKFFDKHLESPNEKIWAKSVYKKFLVAQSEAALEFQERFKPLITVSNN